MSENLQYLIDRARAYSMSPEEKTEQVRSFAFGNTHYENTAITKGDIDRAMESLEQEREPRNRS
jgi:hypothetical protein